MRVRIYPYKLASSSARRLSRHFNGLSVRPDGNYRPRRGDVIINWGNGRVPDWNYNNVIMINPPDKVARAGNKLLAFNMMEGTTPIVSHATNPVNARAWLQEGHKVVVRHTLRGHSGEGIELLTGAETPVPLAPLYTKYIKKNREYRVHVFRYDYKNGYPLSEGEPHYSVVDVQQKLKRQDTPTEEVNYQIRNHHTGWIYARQDIDIPVCIIEAAKAAVRALELDFGAVDIIYNERYNTCYVLEVNTAPGLSGDTTFNTYVDQFYHYIGE